MKIETVALDSISPDPANLRKHGDRGPGIPMRADVTKFDFPAFDLGSLAGYQRPISESGLPGRPCRFFQMAEFAGWIIEKPLDG